MHNLILLLILAFLFFNRPLMTPAYQAQEPPRQPEQTVRLKTELVQLRAVVLDKQGQPVLNLKKEDFEILDNNRPQEISFFSVETVNNSSPLNKPQGTGNLRHSAESPARTIVLFVDTIHISFENFERTKQALRRFVNEQMTDKDLVALVTSSGSLGLLEQFTRDRNLLRMAIDRLRLWQVVPQPSLFTPFLAARVDAGDQQAIALGAEIVRMEEMLPQAPQSYIRAKAKAVLTEASFRRRATLSTLNSVVERLAEMPGQRLLALFTEGFTLSSFGGGKDTENLQPAITHAARTGVVIYSIAAQGLQPLLVPPSVPGIVSVRQGGRGQRSGNMELPTLSSYMAEAARDLEDGMNALARDTGGEAFFNTNDLSGRLQKALDDNRAYYSLDYAAPGDTPEGKEKGFHRITVRVKGHPDYKVRTQRGYQFIEKKPEEEARAPRQKLMRALMRPLPETTIPIAAAADYFESESDTNQVSIQVHIDANAIQYQEQGGHSLFDVELVIAVYDLQGQRVYFASKEAHGEMTPERLEAAKRNGHLYIERIALKPGTYQVRVGLLEPATEKLGTATAWVEVPDLNKGKLTLSAIILATERKSNDLEAKPAASGETLSPAATQGVRVYKRGEVLNYSLKAYPAKNVADPLLMQIEVLQGERQIFQSQWVDAATRLVGKDRKGMLLNGQLLLNNLKPGIYELNIMLKESSSKKAVRSTVLFGVEP